MANQPEIFKRIYSQSENDFESVESRYNTTDKIKDKFVVARETPVGYEFLVFRNITGFKKYAQTTQNNFHEVIFGWMHQKLKFDIDATSSIISQENMAEALKQIDDAIIEAFYLLYSKQIDQFDIINCSSCGQSDKGYKFSYHKIIRGFCVENNKEAKNFTDKVLDILPVEYHKLIDQSVNKSLQNFRILGSAKIGSTRKKIAEDTKVTLEDTLISHIFGCELLPRKYFEQEREEPDIVLSEDIEQVLKMAEPYLEGQELRDMGENAKGLLCFRRTAPSYCHICARIHDRDNTAMITISNNNGISSAYFKCRHSPNNSIYLGQFYSLSSPDLPPDKEVEKASRIIKRWAENPPEFADDKKFRDLPANQRNIYTDEKIRPFELVDTLCVKAAMRMGKTKALLDFINANFADTPEKTHRIMFVSFRQTFSANIQKKFPGFTLYSEVKGRLDQPKLIIQVESLNRVLITPNMPLFDLLILDESELILEQFDSGLLKQFNKSWAVFQWLMANSRHVICMDAAMSCRTFNVLTKMRIEKPNREDSPRQIFFHCNEYKNGDEDEYYFTADKIQWYSYLYKRIEAGDTIAIPMNSLKEAEILHANIQRRYPSKKIGIYSSKTSASQKKEHFNNVDEFWSIYDILIYTPTVSAGVSFETKHFDKLFAYFTDRSCNVEVCIQMMGRIRNVADHEFVICLSVAGGNFPTKIEDIRRAINNSRSNLFKDFDDTFLQFEYNEMGEIKYYNTDYFELWLENMRVKNISKNSFVKRIMSYINSNGSIIDILEHKAENASIIANENIETRQKLRDLTAGNITESPELTSDEVTEIQEKFMTQDEISEEKLSSYEKYKLRRDYNWAGKIDANFVNKYRNDKMRRNYKNLRRIMAKPDILQSLRQIQAEERAIYIASLESNESQNIDISRKYVYDQHRVAISLIKLCGWNDLQDRRWIPEATIFANVCKNEKLLFDNLCQTSMDYGIRAPSIKQFHWNESQNHVEYTANIVAYFNKVLDVMYGVKIKPEDKSKTMYKLSEITAFSLLRGEENPRVPNIFANWEPPNYSDDTSLPIEILAAAPEKPIRTGQLQDKDLSADSAQNTAFDLLSRV